MIHFLLKFSNEKYSFFQKSSDNSQRFVIDDESCPADEKPESVKKCDEDLDGGDDTPKVGLRFYKLVL